MDTASRDRVLAIIYAATIFVSAFLLFQVQPLVSKHILPWFGGTPAVWTTCMLFFQMLLFAGYAYAHGSQQWLRPRQQAALHIGVLVAAGLLLVVMGMLPGERWMPRDSNQPVLKILVLLGATIGLPYFVLATTGPLVQAWYARSFPGRVPYRLYALSNFGSLLALLSYPFFFEWMFDLPRQAMIWSTGFVAFVLLCGYAAYRLRESAADEGEGTDEASRTLEGVVPESVVAPTITQIVSWLVFPALASMTLLATTNYVCADVAVVPFLWIVPLALYLVTFIIAFDHPRWYLRIATAIFTLVAIYGVGILRSSGLGVIDLYSETGIAGTFLQWIHEPIAKWFAEEGQAAGSLTLDVGFKEFLIVNFAAMFGIAMLCHGELVRQRPHPRFLTLFYLMIAAGGAVGGIAVTFVAPQVFDTYFEWELSIILGCLLAIGLILRTIVDFMFDEAVPTRRRLAISPLALLVLLPAGVEVMDLVKFLQPSNEGVVYAVRNFFGALTVRERGEDEFSDKLYTLRHGAIAHGSQFVDPAKRAQPITYYGTPTGISRAVTWYRKQQRPGGMRVGVIGLGTGTMAAFVGAGDHISFYEINPAVIDITESGKWFTYIQDAKERGAEYEIKLGDARLTMTREINEGRPQKYHVILMDAFSGDAIPAHLLTEEMFEIYLKHLSTTEGGDVPGALVVHISNRYVNLEPIVRGAAERYGLLSAQIENDPVIPENISSATYIVLSKNQQLIDDMQQYAKPPGPDARPAILWTDKRSNLFEVLKN